MRLFISLSRFTALALLAVFARSAPAQQIITSETLTDEHVQKAIEAMIEETYARKQPETFWDPKQWTYVKHGEESQGGGYTAIAVLSLLYAGESYQSPRLRDAVDHLMQLPMQGTYARALRTHVWAQLPNRFRDKLSDDTQWLLGAFSERAVGWDYDMNPNTGRKDNSLRQYAILGLWEAAKRGIEIEPRYWQMFEDAFIDCQLANGAWNYKADSAPPRGSMTAAGLTVLFITQDFLHAAEAVDADSRAGRNNRSIELGLQWMEQNFSPTSHPGRNADFYYYLYGVERVGLASGYKFFGEHDWFREGAAELIRRICEWNPTTGTMTVYDRAEGRGPSINNHHLAFALMFLSRGRVPVVINKLQIDGLAWNNRPRDVANLTTSIRDFTETNVIWQIVDFDARPEDWLDAPLAYLASDEPLPWLANVDVNPAAFKREVRDFLDKRASGELPMDAAPPDRPDVPELNKLKRYLDLGGTLLAVNEGSRDSFAKSIETAGTLMYPQYEWRVLPDDHPIFTITPTRGRKPRLKALSNGVRELIIISNTDLSRTFQTRDRSNPTEYQVAANIFFYASEMNRARPRLARHVYEVSKDASGVREAVIVRAIHSGNWKPEPRAHDSLEAYLADTRDLSLRLLDRPLHSIGDLDVTPMLVHVSGIDAHEFSEAEREAVRKYVQSGGTILFDTPGGLGEFTLSAEQMAANLFNQPIQTMLRHELITGDRSDTAPNLSRVQYRPFALEQFGSRELTPRLRAMGIEGEPRIIFSREDLTHGLLDQPGWNIVGYNPQSARDLFGNIIEYAMLNTGYQGR